jgi:hypothetical protein
LNFKLLLWNVDGLSGTLNQITDNNFFKGYDLLCFVETMALKNVNISGYHSINLLATKENRGRPVRGISIFYNNIFGEVKNSIKIKDCTLITFFQNFVIILCYFHPGMNEIDIEDELLTAFGKINDINDTNIILLGDFNCRLDKNNSKAVSLLELTSRYGLSLCNDSQIKTFGMPRFGSVIDLVFVSKNFNNENIQVDPLASNKTHHPVKCELKLKCTELPKYIERTQDKPVHKIDLDTLKFLIDENYVHMRHLLDSDNIQDFYCHILRVIKNSRKAPKKSNRRSKPWFDKECYLLRSEIISLYHFLITTDFEDINLVDLFKQRKKQYKNLIKNKKLAFQRKKEEEIIMAAESQAYHFLHRPENEQNFVQNPIPVNTWAEHMSEVLNSDKVQAGENINLAAMLDNYNVTIPHEPFNLAEVNFAIKSLKNKKAPGPDLILNENIKTIHALAPTLFLEFFNKCLSLGKIPAEWKNSLMKILYKNKGNVHDINSYRGICLSNTLCKLLDKLMARRILEKFKDIIPEQQYGFMPEKSTLDAINDFQSKIYKNIGKENFKKYAVFIDLKKAFDLSDRKIYFQKLIDKNRLSKQELFLLATLFETDYIQIDDKVSLSDIFAQSNGFKQGMCSSPICFNIYIHDILSVFEGIEGVEFLLYADDMVFISDSLEKLDQIMHKFLDFCTKNKMQVNFDKTKILRFTNLGRGSKGNDKLIVDGHNIEFVNSFPYLGVTFQPCGVSFSKHITQRCKNALTAMHFGGNLRDLSLKCAKELFSLKFAPIATYGIQCIWPYLKKCDFLTLESLMMRYYKRVLGLSKTARNTLVHFLIEEKLFSEIIQEKFDLPFTIEYEKFQVEIEERAQREFDPYFFETLAMCSDVWKQPLFKNRHVYTRFAVHGFHHLICTDRANYHDAKEGCVCKLCGKDCDQYHLENCEKRVLSITDYAHMAKDKT